MKLNCGALAWRTCSPRLTSQYQGMAIPGWEADALLHKDLVIDSFLCYVSRRQSLEMSRWILTGSSQSNVCDSFWPMPASVAISGNRWQVACFRFVGVAGYSMRIPWLAKLNENTEPLRIKIDVLGNRRGLSFCDSSWWEPTLSFQFPLCLAGLRVHLE